MAPDNTAGAAPETNDDLLDGGESRPDVQNAPLETIANAQAVYPDIVGALDDPERLFRIANDERRRAEGNAKLAEDAIADLRHLEQELRAAQEELRLLRPSDDPAEDGDETAEAPSPEIDPEGMGNAERAAAGEERRERYRHEEAKTSDWILDYCDLSVRERIYHAAIISLDDIARGMDARLPDRMARDLRRFASKALGMGTWFWPEGVDDCDFPAMEDAMGHSNALAVQPLQGLGFNVTKLKAEPREALRIARLGQAYAEQNFISGNAELADRIDDLLLDLADISADVPGLPPRRLRRGIAD